MGWSFWHIRITRPFSIATGGRRVAEVRRQPTNRLIALLPPFCKTYPAPGDNAPASQEAMPRPQEHVTATTETRKQIHTHLVSTRTRPAADGVVNAGRRQRV